MPLREGETLDSVAVSEGDTGYRPGASAELGSSGAPGTFGVAETDDGVRIVWHYDANSEQRTFTVKYRLRGLAVAYDDVVDVNLRVWGDEWEVGLARLTADLVTPNREPVRRVWGHPVTVRGDVRITGEGATLRALDIPPGQWVELRALVPRDAFTSTAGMQVESGNGLQEIVREETEAAQQVEEDRERIDDAVDHLPRTLLLLALLGLLPALGLVYAVYRIYGREREVGYDREYEQEPPTELEPALVPSLVAQRTRVGSNEFTATLFDLIRRGSLRGRRRHDGAEDVGRPPLGGHR